MPYQSFPKKSRFLAIFPFMALFISCKAMERVEVSSQSAPDKLAQLKLEEIKPVSAVPFTQVPLCVYANCNQYTCHTWNDKVFDAFKKRAKETTKGQHYQALLEAKQAMPAQAKELIEKFDLKGELFDWIHGVDLVETKYLKDKRPLTVEDCKAINAAVTRLCMEVENPGDFRTDSSHWAKRTLTFTEQVFQAYFSAHVERIRRNEDPLLHRHGRFLYVANLRHFYEYLITEKKFLASVARFKESYTKDPVIDFEEIEQWVALQKHLPDYKEGMLDGTAWETMMIHYFPEADQINGLLAKALQESMKFSHPIAQAAYIWYSIIAIHPFCEAHKRTGKLLASIILLRNGYLPPVITQEDAERYTHICIEAFDKKDGYIDFIAFCAELIKKTQEQYKKQLP